MTELTVMNNNPRLKFFSRFFTPIISLGPSYTRNLFRAYTQRESRENTYRRNIFIKKRPLFK